MQRQGRETQKMPHSYNPSIFDPHSAVSSDFLQFLLPLHKEFTPRQQFLIAERERLLAEAHRGKMPNHLPASQATLTGWKVELPAWCQDQRNQMTGPADDAELVVKMLNSGAPGVMLDLEDSTANEWPHLKTGIQNILEALKGNLTYFDEKHGKSIGIVPGNTVIWLRPRGLHLSQTDVIPGREKIAAPLLDMAAIVYSIDPDELKHPLSFYIPKSESAEEGLWWRDVFQGTGRGKRSSPRLHQVHGAGGVSPAGLPDGGICI